jgi:hypothetical protein
MKTQGQRLYEYKHPSHIRVIPVEARQFATADDVIVVPNPTHHVPWHLLTEKCRQGWEQTAIGHHLFTGERQ